MTRLEKIGDIQTPYDILNKYKKDVKIFEFVKNSRQIISDIINKKDERLMVISNPLFLGLDLFGQIAKMQSFGNPDGHIILRGHDKGTNYDKESVFRATEKLIQNHINTGIIIDFSHGNSMKKYYNQIKVCDDVCNQLEYGNKNIVGVMIEGNINPGNQCIGDNLSYGVSITDECVGWDDNETMIKKLNNASYKRKTLKNIF